MVDARVVDCPVGAVGVDSLPFSQAGTPEQAQALKASGVDFIALYLGVATEQQTRAALDAGLLVFGVTLANRYDGQRSAEQANQLGLPAGCALFLDLEGRPAYDTPAASLIAAINAWADAVAAVGYVPGIYVGSPQPLTTDELTRLHVVRYWRAPARVVDRHGALAEPAPGWCMVQAWPSVTRGGVFVDVDFAYQDFKGRVAPMAGAAG